MENVSSRSVVETELPLCILAVSDGGGAQPKVAVLKARPMDQLLQHGLGAPEECH